MHVCNTVLWALPSVPIRHSTYKCIHIVEPFHSTFTVSCSLYLFHAGRRIAKIPIQVPCMKTITKQVNTGQHHQASHTLRRLAHAISKNTHAKAVRECADSGWGGESPHSHEEGNTRPETSAIGGRGNDVYMLHVLIYHFTHTSLPFNRQLMKWVSRELNAGQHHQACEGPSTIATTLLQIQLQRRFNKQLEEFAYSQVISLKINLIKVY